MSPSGPPANSQDDIVIDEKTGDVQLSNDPRAFTSRPVGQRMIVVSAGVVFNVIFAALLFMVAFLWGLPRTAPVLGDVEPDGPAARAGLLSGDTILTIDDQPAHSFNDLLMAAIFSDGALRLKIERAGQVFPEEVIVTPEWDERRGLRRIGVAAPHTTQLIEDGKPWRTIPRGSTTIIFRSSPSSWTSAVGVRATARSHRSNRSWSARKTERLTKSCAPRTKRSRARFAGKSWIAFWRPRRTSSSAWWSTF